MVQALLSPAVSEPAANKCGVKFRLSTVEHASCGTAQVCTLLLLLSSLSHSTHLTSHWCQLLPLCVAVCVLCVLQIFFYQIFVLQNWSELAQLKHALVTSSSCPSSCNFFIICSSLAVWLNSAGLVSCQICISQLLQLHQVASSKHRYDASSWDVQREFFPP